MSQRAKKNSKFHPARPCTKCILCGKSQAHYSHFQQWSEDEQSFLIFHLGQKPAPDSCICRAHHTEANRHSSEGNYIPKWKKDSVVVKCDTTCVYPGCNVISDEANACSGSDHWSVMVVHLIPCTWDAVTTYTPVTVFYPLGWQLKIK